MATPAAASDGDGSASPSSSDSDLRLTLDHVSSVLSDAYGPMVFKQVRVVDDLEGISTRAVLHTLAHGALSLPTLIRLRGPTLASC